MTYYVALYGGFAVNEQYPTRENGTTTKTFTTADIRTATSWDTAEAADAFAKYAVQMLYPPDLRHFAVLRTTTGGS